jgi:ABC-2 type transport system permease protein
VREVGGVPYMSFIVPGLVLLGVIQNAFLNTSSSLFIAKIQGTMVDLLVAPLGTFDLLAAFTLAAVVRGLLVGVLTWGVASVFAGVHVAHPIAAVLFATLVAATFAWIGLAVAIWSDKFEQLNLVPTFVLTPLTFLGGVFYSPSMLPGVWGHIARANPVLYMVEGLRHALLGHADSSPLLGLVVTGGIAAAAGATVLWMLSTGYKLRS